MPLDSQYVITTSKLTAIGDAIRAKTGSAASMTLDEMVTAIGSISGGGSSELQTGKVTFASAAHTFTLQIPAQPSHVMLFVSDDADIDTTNTWKLTEFMISKWGSVSESIMRYGASNRSVAASSTYSWENGVLSATIGSNSAYKTIANVEYTWFAW